MAAAIKAHLPRGGVFWDVGANIGLMSLYADRIAGPAGAVVAFEPSPGVLQQLRANVGNTRIEVLPYGIGNEDGERKFAAQGTSSSASFHKVVTAINEGYSLGQAIVEVQVTIRKLDTVLDGRKPPILLKIDIEGFELEAIKGADRLLSQHHPKLLIEVHPMQLGMSGGNEQELFARLDAIGYTRSIIDQNPNGLYTLLAT